MVESLQNGAWLKCVRTLFKPFIIVNKFMKYQCYKAKLDSICKSIRMWALSFFSPEVQCTKTAKLRKISERYQKRLFHLKRLFTEKFILGGLKRVNNKTNFLIKEEDSSHRHHKQHISSNRTYKSRQAKNIRKNIHKQKQYKVALCVGRFHLHIS